MKRVTLESGLLARVAYDADARLLDVELRNGRCYRYFDVPEIVFAGLLRAVSKGRFFNDRIRDAFASSRLPPQPSS